MAKRKIIISATETTVTPKVKAKGPTLSQAIQAMVGTATLGDLSGWVGGSTQAGYTVPLFNWDTPGLPFPYTASGSQRQFGMVKAKIPAIKSEVNKLAFQIGLEGLDLPEAFRISKAKGGLSKGPRATELVWLLGQVIHTKGYKMDTEAEAQTSIGKAFRVLGATPLPSA